jgi:serine/threonine-protein kinase
MTDRNELLVGQIALNNRLITREQLDFCLSMQESGLTELPLGELLYEQGFLTREQLDKILEAHEKVLNDPVRQSNVKKKDVLFGRMVVASGLASQDAVNSCLRQQEHLHKQGRFQNLGEILVEKGILTVEQVKDVLKKQQKIIMQCGSCGTKFNVPAFLQNDNFKCLKCGTILTSPKNLDKIRVEASLSGDGTADSLVGRELGGCRLMDLIGKGNYGRVYKAKHIGLNKHVCVKVLPTSGHNEDMIKRFILEARAAAKLEHPNIVQVYNVGREGPYCFIVMQYIEGRSLDGLIADGAGFVVNDALMIIREVTRGLIMAHNTGIVHRDLKPDNILIADNGQIKITDFGLAQDVEYQGVVESEGLLVGTPYYMSPEAWQGRSDLDGRSDLYSLGVILYYMLTTRRPFEALKIADLRRKHLEQPPLGAEKINPEVPEILSAIINRLLEKDPEARFQNGEEFLAALDEVDRFQAEADAAPDETVIDDIEVPVAEPTDSEDTFHCPNCHTQNTLGDDQCAGCEMEFCQACFVEIAMVKGRCPECIANQKDIQPKPQPRETTPKRPVDRRRRRRRR